MDRKQLEDMYTEACVDFMDTIEMWNGVGYIDDSVERMEEWKKEFNRLFDKIITIRKQIKD